MDVVREGSDEYQRWFGVSPIGAWGERGRQGGRLKSQL